MSREGCCLELECSIILSQIEINGQNLLYDKNAVVCQNISIHISVYKICKKYCSDKSTDGAIYKCLKYEYSIQTWKYKFNEHCSYEHYRAQV